MFGMVVKMDEIDIDLNSYLKRFGEISLEDDMITLKIFDSISIDFVMYELEKIKSLLDSLKAYPELNTVKLKTRSSSI